jgi:pyrimidine-specific ribonucleoside hydrolase
MKKINVLFDMETADPDDVMTLCFLISHPQICLRSVTIMLGTDEQVGLVKSILQQANLNIPIGSFSPNSPKKVVSPFYYRWLGDFLPQKPDNEGFEIIQNALNEFPDLQILTGAPMRNFSKIGESIICERWVAQGGFAGDNVVP